MKKYLVVLVTLCVFGALAVLSAPVRPGAAAYPHPQSSASDDAVKSAFQSTLEANRMQVAGFVLYDVGVDRIDYSQDGATAALWLSMTDQQTGQVVATEPGLSIARLLPGADPSSPDSWQVALPGTPDFQDQVAALPEGLLGEDARQLYLTSAAIQPPGTRTYTGYKLPWSAGQKKFITNAIGHIYNVAGGWASCPDSCRYAFDFADNTMFPILAAKGGTIKAYRTTCANNDHNCANYLVLEDQSTSPVTYQLYYHMMNESIPQRFRVIGTPVLQGEYIGNADNTGPSTGSHLHFHVYERPVCTDCWSWGISADIVFDDVTTNGGRPRTCAEAHDAYTKQFGSECMPGDEYTSGNIPAHPPTGKVTTLTDRSMITSQSILIGGTTTSGEGLARVQVLGSWSGTWTQLESFAPESSGAFYKDLDLCAANVPDGPLDILVKVYDRAGNQAIASPGGLHLFKNFYCSTVQVPPPPPCTPAPDQVALYAQPDFEGSCKLFSARTSGYGATELGLVGDNNTASVQVGSNARAVLYDLSSDLDKAIPSGRIETLDTSDANLADNRIGSDHVSALLILSPATPPDEPFLTYPSLRLDGSGLTSVDSVVLAWSGGEGGTSFDVSLTGSGVNQSWSNLTRPASISIGTLPAGSYSWTVRAKNSAGSNGTTHSFNVAAGALPLSAVRNVPFSDDVESGINNWIATGLWRRDSVAVGGRNATQAWLYRDGSGYADNIYRGGDLTSPPIYIPSAGPTYLTFQYFADVEDGSPNWDRRQVQVFDSAGRVTDLYQLSDDQQFPDQFWLSSPPLSLAAFAGQNIRLRFHFDTVDPYYNDGQGWMIDNIQVNTQGPVSGCADSDKNNIENAQQISVGAVVKNALICPQGDADYYKFSAQAGQVLRMDIDAQSKGSAFDSQIYLIDSDKQSVLAWNDDEVLGSNHDSLLTYTLQRTGTYYLKVKAWDSPGVGGSNYFYDLKLQPAPVNVPRLVRVVYPADPKRIPQVPFEEVVQAEDFDGGPVAKVEFYWHGPDWVNGVWLKVATDSDGSDGWSAIVYPLLYGDVNGSALFVQAFNSVGAAAGSVMWDLAPDLEGPTSQLNSLPAQTNGTAVHLTWTASDPTNDIDHFEFQYQENSGSGFGGWIDWNFHPAGWDRSTWFVGAAGHSYNFRLRAVDRAGNVQPFASTVGATTTILSACSIDAYEPGDNAASQASVLSSGVYQAHNFCQADVDWFSFQVQPGDSPALALDPLGTGAAFIVNIYNHSMGKVASFQSGGYGLGMIYQASSLPAGWYYLEVKPLASALYGTDVRYAIKYSPAGSQVIFPYVRK